MHWAGYGAILPQAFSEYFCSRIFLHNFLWYCQGNPNLNIICHTIKHDISPFGLGVFQQYK